MGKAERSIPFVIPVSDVMNGLMGKSGFTSDENEDVTEYPSTFNAESSMIASLYGESPVVSISMTT